MSKKSKLEEVSYKTGYKIGGLLMNGIIFIFKIFFRGIKTGFSLPILGIFYIVFIITIVILSVLGSYNFTTYVELMAITLVFAVGIKSYISDYPTIRKRKLFNSLFIEIKLTSNDGNTPIFIGEEKLSDFVGAFYFNTLVPLSDWLNKKDIIEMYLNTKIINIKQSLTDNRVIYIEVEVEPLPELVEWNDSFLNEDINIFNIGAYHYGVIGVDIRDFPHMFIAGETGSGKSNILKCFIYQALLKEMDVILIDFKRGVTFSSFSDFVSIYYEYDSALEKLQEMVSETKNRLDKFRLSGVDNIDDYNKNNADTDYLHRKIIFIDEVAELLKTRDKNISNSLNDCLETLTRLSRATGIHLIMGLQRPDSTIISGQIKNNVPYRICGRFTDKEPSRIMLGDDSASKLSNIKGRFIVKDNNIQEVQCFYFTDKNINLKNLYSDKIEVEVKEVKKDEVIETIAPTKGLDFDFSDIKK